MWFLRPIDNFCGRGYHNVRKGRRVDHDCKTHSSSFQTCYEPVNVVIPCWHLVINPQAIQSRCRHQIQLCVDCSLVTDVVCPQIAGVVWIAILQTPVVVLVSTTRPGLSARFIDVVSQEPGQVVTHKFPQPSTNQSVRPLSRLNTTLKADQNKM